MRALAILATAGTVLLAWNVAFVERFARGKADTALFALGAGLVWMFWLRFRRRE